CRRWFRPSDGPAAISAVTSAAHGRGATAQHSLTRAKTVSAPPGRSPCLRFFFFLAALSRRGPVPLPPGTPTPGRDFFGGGTLGCNWQPVNSPFVLGLEGEAGYMRLSGNAFDPRTIISTQTVLDVLGSAKVGDWYGMVTGRLGYAWDRWLLYVKGGAAFVP